MRQLRADLAKARGRLEDHEAAVNAIRTIAGDGPLPPEWSTSWQDRAQRGERRAAKLRTVVESALRLLGSNDHAGAQELLRSTLEASRRPDERRSEPRRGRR